MTEDPVRLLSQKGDAFEASLLASAREGDRDAARSHKALVLGAAGGAALGGAAVVSAAKLSPGGFFAMLGGKWLMALIVTLGGLGVGAALLWPRDVRQSPAGDAPPSLQARSDTAAALAPDAKSSPPPASTSAPSAPSAAPASGAAPGLAEEVAALRAAHEALGRGQSQRCLDAVNAYFAAFPSGHLSAEARYLRVEAMFAGGQRAQAAALARTMLAGNPKSPYATRLRVIAGEP